MTIRLIQDSDYEQLITLYKEFFPTHNRFQQDADIITAYLRKETLEREDFLIYEQDGKILGALIIVLLGKSTDNSHTRWKFRHFAFINETIAAELLTHAENTIKEKSQTAKIELTIAETEQGIDFYKQHGYTQEAELKNHYRWNETCFILGKSFSS